MSKNQESIVLGNCGNERRKGTSHIMPTPDDLITILSDYNYKEKSASMYVMGTLGKARKSKIISIEEFDINFTPNKINIKKFIDTNGKEMVEMWYEL